MPNSFTIITIYKLILLPCLWWNKDYQYW